MINYRTTLIISLIAAVFCPNASAADYTREKVIAARPNVVWENPAPRPVPPEMAVEITAANTLLNLDKVIVKTPLRLLDRISRLTGKAVYLKDDSYQLSGSFKIRGVANEILKAGDQYDERIIDLISLRSTEITQEPLYAITQTDGNHGIAMIEALAAIMGSHLQTEPDYAPYIKRVEPVVFTIKSLPAIKKSKMFAALEHYRRVVGDSKKGLIDDRYETYADAKKARLDFLAKNRASAVYMNHGGTNIMCGNASVGLEVAEQLKELGVGSKKKVAFLVPVGAGGPVGMLAGLKASRPGSFGIVVQTTPYSAFVRSLISGSLVSNEPEPPPTAILNGQPIVFENGIAVDAPEPKAVNLAKRIVDCGLVVDPQATLNYAAPLLYADLSKYPEPVVGGTTAAAMEALLEYPDVLAIKNADVIVVLGAESNVDPEVTEYIKGMVK